jgi:hypothetical protein
VVVAGLIVALAFTAWRLVANIKALLGSLAELNRKLAPVLEELGRQSEQAASKAAALSARSAAVSAAARQPKRANQPG